MTINYSLSPFLCPILGGYGFTGANAGISLDSDFTLGTAGACFGLRFLSPLGGVHIHSAYFFLHAANATSHALTCHIANYGASTIRAGTSIRSVTTDGGTTANKWIKFDFSAYEDALTANEYYWLVVGDATGSGSGYSIRGRNSSHSTNSSVATTSSYSSTTGFTTNGTSITYPVSTIIVFSDGSIIGHPYTQSITPTTSTLARGMKFSFDEKVTCKGLLFTSASQISTLNIYSGSTAPGGTLWSVFNSGNAYTILTNQKNLGALWFPSSVTFEKDTIYRITFGQSSLHAAPGYNEVEDAETPNTDALACCLGAGSWCYTIDNGAGGWTDYDNATDGYRLARMSLILQSQVAIASGSAHSFGG